MYLGKCGKGMVTVGTVVFPCLDRDMNRLILHVHKCHSKYGMKNCRHTGCHNHQHGTSGLYVSPSNRQPLAPSSVTDHLYIYQHMCSNGFVLITGLLHDLSSLIWTLLYVNHFMQFCTHFRIQIQSNLDLQYTILLIINYKVNDHKSNTYAIKGCN